MLRSLAIRGTVAVENEIARELRYELAMANYTHQWLTEWADGDHAVVPLGTQTAMLESSSLMPVSSMSSSVGGLGFGQMMCTRVSLCLTGNTEGSFTSAFEISLTSSSCI